MKECKHSFTDNSIDDEGYELCEFCNASSKPFKIKNEVRIEVFDTYTETFVKSFANTIEELQTNERAVKNTGNIFKTNNDSINKTYFFMTDKFGHTTFYRMTTELFDKEYYK